MKKYQDNFSIQHLPDQDLQPIYRFLDDPRFWCPENLNCVSEILDRHITEGNGDRIAVRSEYQSWTYKQLYEKANQIAHVLVQDLDFVSGNRVLIRSANNPMFVACWFGILKAGGIAVATMPLLRKNELNTIIECAEVTHAFCDIRLREELSHTDQPWLKSTLTIDGTGRIESGLEIRMKTKPVGFDNFETGAESVALIGFTSGTTGKPKMTAHFHRDILLICKSFPPYALQIRPEDIVTGSPPIGFTFGLGGLVLFPLYYGASSFLIEKPTPDLILEAISRYKVTICFTAPTAWRVLNTRAKEYDLSSLRKCISAGEALPVKVWEDWFHTTGLRIVDGIGATEMLHIFISANENDQKKGALGKPIPGYEAVILDASGKEAPAGEIGRLAVRGITGCKYLNRKEKQKEYVQNFWNITGDLFRKDEEGYFWFVSRGDNMIISSGYNIAALEVESVLIHHPEIVECAVIGKPDEDRGHLVCAFIVLRDPAKANEAMARQIQDWFKQEAAPYKYPREIQFVSALPKTETGKIQHFKLKEIHQ
jgi:2-aminobenzoate-CoA ligase